MLQRIREFLGVAGPSIPVLPVDLDEIRPLLRQVAEREAREAQARRPSRRALSAPAAIPLARRDLGSEIAGYLQRRLEGRAAGHP